MEAVYDMGVIIYLPLRDFERLAKKHVGDIEEGKPQESGPYSPGGTGPFVVNLLKGVELDELPKVGDRVEVGLFEPIAVEAIEPSEGFPTKILLGYVEEDEVSGDSWGLEMLLEKYGWEWCYVEEGGSGNGYVYG